MVGVVMYLILSQHGFSFKIYLSLKQTCGDREMQSPAHGLCPARDI